MAVNASRIELADFITRKSLEEAYRHARRHQEMGRSSASQVGFRAARARDPRMLLALQKGSEILQQMSEEQFGQHGLECYGGYKTPATEFQLWREAYVTADRGEALENFAWVYAAAAFLSGLYN